MMTLMTGLCTTTAAQKPWAHAEMQDSDEEIWQVESQAANLLCTQYSNIMASRAVTSTDSDVQQQTQLCASQNANSLKSQA